MRGFLAVALALGASAAAPSPPLDADPLLLPPSAAVQAFLGLSPAFPATLALPLPAVEGEIVAVELVPPRPEVQVARWRPIVLSPSPFALALEVVALEQVSTDFTGLELTLADGSRRQVDLGRVHIEVVPDTGLNLVDVRSLRVRPSPEHLMGFVVANRSRQVVHLEAVQFAVGLADQESYALDDVVDGGQAVLTVQGYVVPELRRGLDAGHLGLELPVGGAVYLAIRASAAFVVAAARRFDPQRPAGFALAPLLAYHGRDGQRRFYTGSQVSTTVGTVQP